MCTRSEWRLCRLRMSLPLALAVLAMSATMAAAQERAPRTPASSSRAPFEWQNDRAFALNTGAESDAARQATLEGTAWRLVKFHAADGSTVTPDDPAKYTVRFEAGGRLTVRVDCNRGSGAWKSVGRNQLQLGPLALTRVKCPPGSLFDLFVKHWTSVRASTIKDSHLWLSLRGSRGAYEFEPIEPLDD